MLSDAEAKLLHFNHSALICRVNELEKQLQLVKQGAEMTSPPEELSSDGELSAEHRFSF